MLRHTAYSAGDLEGLPSGVISSVVGKSSVNEGFLMGKSSRNGRSSIAMFDYRSVNPSDLKNTTNPSVGVCLISNTNRKQKKHVLGQSVDFLIQTAETHSIACESSQYHQYLYIFHVGNR
jgi:hypothetical protein